MKDQTAYPTGQISATFNGNYPGSDTVSGEVVESGSRTIAGSSGNLNGLATWISVTLPEEVIIQNIRVVTFPSATTQYFNEVSSLKNIESNKRKVINRYDTFRLFFSFFSFVILRYSHTQPVKKFIQRPD